MVDWTMPLQLKKDGRLVRLLEDHELDRYSFKGNPDCDGDYWIIAEDDGSMPDGAPWSCVAPDTDIVVNRLPLEKLR